MKLIPFILAAASIALAVSVKPPPSKSAILRVNLTNIASSVRSVSPSPHNGSCRYVKEIDFSLPEKYGSCPTVLIYELDDARENSHNSFDCYYNLSPVSHNFALTVLSQKQCPDAILSLPGFVFLKSVFF